jgi:hypothetical protein
MISEACLNHLSFSFTVKREVFERDVKIIVTYSEWNETFALKWKQNLKDFRLIIS